MRGIGSLALLSLAMDPRPPDQLESHCGTQVAVSRACNWDCGACDCTGISRDQDGHVHATGSQFQEPAEMLGAGLLGNIGSSPAL